MCVCGQWIQSWSKDQSKVARSSGETGLHDCNLGASRGLGLQAIMKELGWSYEVKIKVDANATIGTLHRRGLGKLRRVEVEELWRQQEISKKKVSVTKIKGVENTADIGTNAIYRLASALQALRLDLELFPPTVKAMIAAFEKSNNFEMGLELLYLTVNKDDTKKKLLPFFG